MNGSWFGTRWRSDSDGVEVTWPTFFLAPMFACFGFFLTGLMGFWAFMNGDWIWPVLLFLISVVATIFSVLFRENLFVDRDGMSITRWPAGWKGTDEHPLEDIINAIVQLEIIYGRNTRKIGTVKIRVRSEGQILWYEIGQDLGWHNARKIGQALDAYMPVRLIQSE